jgi:lipoprotein-anchoring transpeptidase ErfK/SrfK
VRVGQLKYTFDMQICYHCANAIKLLVENMKAENENLNAKRPKLKAHHYVGFFVGALILSLVTTSGGAAWFYKDRALPNVSVGSLAVGDVKQDKIKVLVNQQAAAMRATFINGKDIATIPAKDVGVAVDTDATVRQVLQARKQGDILTRIQLWQTQNVPLVLHNDAGALKDYVKQHFPAIFIDAKDASLVYNESTNQFDIQPSSTGKGFDVRGFESNLPSLASQPRNIILPVSTLPTEPLISSQALIPIQNEANQRLKSSLQFLLKGNVVYSATPADIAGWMHFIPDPVKGTVHIEYDKAKIQQFIDQKVAGSVAAPAVDRKIIVDQVSGSQTVIQPGSVGQQIQDTDILAANVQMALVSNQPFSKEISIVEAPFKTVTIAETGKWIEVDLSQQKTTLYVGSTAIQSFIISSGTAATPTIPGEYHVWYKVASQTMTERSSASGDYFYLPNVKWVSYFDGDRAFHGTYWHHNFGHPMSHGCINMTEDDAKIVYDFAPVGTKVVVHV